MQYNFFIFLIIKNILVLSYHSSHNHYDKTNLYNLAKLLPFNMKSVNPIQKYPRIIESYACILFNIRYNTFTSYEFLTSFGTCSTPKLLK